MNERIKSLIERAEYQAGKHSGSDWEVYVEPSQEQIFEKFAELIVEECMEQINKVEEKGDAHLGGGYFYDGTQLCRDAIKQHFGVEE